MAPGIRDDEDAIEEAPQIPHPNRASIVMGSLPSSTCPIVHLT